MAGTDARPAPFVGWQRHNAPRAVWEPLVRAESYALAWARLLRINGPPGSCERIVLQEGRKP